MEKMKKMIRIVIIICLIVLASVGIGLTGGAVTLPKESRRKTDQPDQTELVEEKQGGQLNERK